jgi:acyl dehydratase
MSISGPWRTSAKLASLGSSPGNTPSRPHYFEDFVTGDVFERGSSTVTEEEIVAFATQWDPFTFHTDPEAAKSSAFGGLAIGRSRISTVRSC